MYMPYEEVNFSILIDTSIMSMRNQVLTLCNGIGNICNVLVTQFLTDLSDVMLLFKQVLCRDNSVVLEKVKSILQARFPIG